MSFNSPDLSVLAYANNFTLWHYTTPDDAVTPAGYFNKAVDMLRKNDLIIANIGTDGAPSAVFYIVTDATDTAVTISAYA